MYITHLTHGAGAQPGTTQPPTASQKSTQNADQCVREPREGRGRNRKTPPQEKKGGGARAAHSHRAAHQHHKRRPKPPIQTAPKTGLPKGAPGDHPAKTGNTKPRAAAHREKGHPKHADTHHAKKQKEHANTKQHGPEEKKWGDRDRETQDWENRRPKKKEKIKGEGGGAHLSNCNTHTPPRHGRPPRKSGGNRGTRTTARTPQQHPPKERRGAAETRTSTHTPTPHNRTMNGREQEMRAHSHARPKALPRTGGVQAKTQPQAQTPRTRAGKRGAKPQTVAKHTHPRPQLGLTGLPKPKPKHNPDPRTNTTQQ